MFGTKNSRITLIGLELIEPDQMTTRPIHEKAQHLHEQLRDWQSLAALAQLAKQTLDKRKKLNFAKVHGKQTQTSPAGQLVISWKNSLNMLFLILPNPRIFAHVALYLLGCVICNGNFVVTHYNITLYLLRRGLFLY